MDKLIEALTFFFSASGGFLIVLCGYLGSRAVYKFINDMSKDNNKKLIKDTVKEMENKNGKPDK